MKQDNQIELFEGVSKNAMTPPKNAIDLIENNIGIIANFSYAKCLYDYTTVRHTFIPRDNAPKRFIPHWWRWVENAASHEDRQQG